MSIVYDYEGIGPLVKGDTWWTAEKPAKEPEPDLRAIEEAAFIRAMAALDWCNCPDVLARNRCDPDLFGKGPAMMAVESFNQALREGRAAVRRSHAGRSRHLLHVAAECSMAATQRRETQSLDN